MGSCSLENSHVDSEIGVTKSARSLAYVHIWLLGMETRRGVYGHILRMAHLYPVTLSCTCNSLPRLHFICHHTSGINPPSVRFVVRNFDSSNIILQRIKASRRTFNYRVAGKKNQDYKSRFTTERESGVVWSQTSLASAIASFECVRLHADYLLFLSFLPPSHQYPV